MMSEWNDMLMAHKLTKVTHSCVGNFTGPQKLNLIVAKHALMEILLFTPYCSLQAMSNLAMDGRIVALELFRPCGETQDLLFVATDQYKFHILQWDAEAAKVLTRVMGDVLDEVGHPIDNGQIGIIDPECRLIGLFLYDRLFTVIPFDNKGLLNKAFNIRLEELQVLDIKFLNGCHRPTIAVLYQDDKYARHVKTYEVPFRDEDFVEGPFSWNDLDHDAKLLISVPPPLFGLLIIGGEAIVYCSASTFKAIPITLTQSITRAYGRVDAGGSRYLLGDHHGRLYLLVIIYEMGEVTGLKLEHLGETFVASSISYLESNVVFVGSSNEDSQLIELNLHLDAKGSRVKVLERYINLGPIERVRVVDLEKQGQGQVVTCSRAYKDSSRRIVRHGIRINEQASAEVSGIKGIWSLRSATDDPYDTFLVVSFINETRVLTMSLENELEETEIQGFNSNVQTLYCHHQVHDQLVQVTPNSVRLVSSTTRELRYEWPAQAGCSINVATTNATQVLLSTGDNHLVYLEIGDGLLNVVKTILMEYDVSCLDINPIGDNSNGSQIAAVGTWINISARIYSLPDLDLITEERLGGEMVPRFLLLCSFEGIPYFLCGLVDGRLLNFMLNTSKGSLTDRKEVSLGTQLMALCPFSSNSTPCVFVASDRPTVMYSSYKRLIYNNVNLKEVRHMCPFYPAASPYCLAIASEGNLIIGTIDDGFICRRP